MDHWRSFRYKNLTLFVISVLFAVLLSRFEPFHAFLLNLGSLGYFGAFLAGILFVSTFTVATGVVILLVLAKQLSPIEIGLVAGFGAVVGDFTIFRFIKDNLLEEITPFYNRFGGNHITTVLHSKYFSWTLPVIGAIVIASPFPDEIGVSLMSIARMKTYQFLILSFILNAVGIFFVVSASTIIKP
ncbi:MAG: hypothetical protein A2782_03665 [Candidatus Blackburnbacteria bacterium RIFCSPHIGHO2_01_FULL_43_15b]|uniref:TVP38/TMEM64 family membrane protein n=1 Tax=Candidatus Blackburnbacteria bacterium RIFCSPHIGHO2_01_FULL_43_15b TaxID=1797513 RepID=A0A1G1UY70_9BACT|nr:MAG: hypothetical protein A2782_03665 [Candidatus Blackburnbacteria bacterium RIFCSPHIGHO2_01_FULL_43_15b]